MNATPYDIMLLLQVTSPGIMPPVPMGGRAISDGSSFASAFQALLGGPLPEAAAFATEPSAESQGTVSGSLLNPDALLIASLAAIPVDMPPSLSPAVVSSSGLPARQSDRSQDEPGSLVLPVGEGGSPIVPMASPQSQAVPLLIPVNDVAMFLTSNSDPMAVIPAPLDDKAPRVAGVDYLSTDIMSGTAVFATERSASGMISSPLSENGAFGLPLATTTSVGRAAENPAPVDGTAGIDAAKSELSVLIAKVAADLKPQIEIAGGGSHESTDPTSGYRTTQVAGRMSLAPSPLPVGTPSSAPVLPTVSPDGSSGSVALGQAVATIVAAKTTGERATASLNAQVWKAVDLGSPSGHTVNLSSKGAAILPATGVAANSARMALSSISEAGLMPGLERPNLATPLETNKERNSGNGDMGATSKPSSTDQTTSSGNSIQRPAASVGQELPRSSEPASPARFIVETPKPLRVPGQITVRLDPPEMGRLQIDLLAGPSGVIGRLRVASDTVRAFVERDVVQLQRSLTDAGVRVERLDIVGVTAGEHRGSESPDAQVSYRWHGDSTQERNQQGGSERRPYDNHTGRDSHHQPPWSEFKRLPWVTAPSYASSLNLVA